MKLIIPALALGIASLYFISRRRKFEFDAEMKMEPRQADTGEPAYEAEH
jgi:hypothetical protein